MAKREYLSVEDHRRVAEEIWGIDAAFDRIIKLSNGKVPVHLLDALCGLGTAQRSILMFRLRKDFFKEMVKRHKESARDFYFNNPDGTFGKFSK